MLAYSRQCADLYCCCFAVLHLQLVLRNVGIAYNDPSVLDTCEQYNQKVLYGLQQQYGAGNISVVNATAGRLVGPITIPVLVLDGSRNNSGGVVAGNSSFAGTPGLVSISFIDSSIAVEWQRLGCCSLGQTMAMQTAGDYMCRSCAGWLLSMQHIMMLTH